MEKNVFILGRSTECDIVINNEFISRKHLKIVNKQNSIEIFDLNSTNGVEIDKHKVQSGTVKAGESFSIRDMEFFLKDGSPEDFILSNELHSKGKEFKKSQSSDILKDNTTYVSGNIFIISLKKILETGLRSKSIEMFFLEASKYISVLFENCILFLFNESNGKIKLLYRFNHVSNEDKIDPAKTAEQLSVFSKEHFSSLLSKNTFISSSYNNDSQNIAFMLLSYKKIESVHFDFLKKFLKIINLIIDLIPKMNKKKKGKKEKEAEESSIVTVNSDIKNLIKKVKKLSKSGIFILLKGESGVGKELFAKMIHDHSKRRDNKFVALNCASIPDNLLESELFGHERGAFTDAYSQKKGKFELSSGGTLLLDEIGEMNINLQAKLLRAIQEETFYRLGGTKPIKVDLRIISSTNKDLHKLIEEGKFREDLYYRLVHVELDIPPLRNRRNDIIPLIKHFTSFFTTKFNKSIRGYSVKAINTLSEYDWPGNIRELKNEIYKLVNLVDDNELIDFDILAPRIKMHSHEMTATMKFNGIKDKLGNFEKENIIKTLKKNKGNKTVTARELEMSYNTLFRKLKKYKIKN